MQPAPAVEHPAGLGGARHGSDGVEQALHAMACSGICRCFTPADQTQRAQTAMVFVVFCPVPWRRTGKPRSLPSQPTRSTELDPLRSSSRLISAPRSGRSKPFGACLSKTAKELSWRLEVGASGRSAARRCGRWRDEQPRVELERVALDVEGDGGVRWVRGVEEQVPIARLDVGRHP